MSFQSVSVCCALINIALMSAYFGSRSWDMKWEKAEILSQESRIISKPCSHTSYVRNGRGGRINCDNEIESCYQFELQFVNGICCSKTVDDNSLMQYIYDDQCLYVLQIYTFYIDDIVHTTHLLLSAIPQTYHHLWYVKFNPTILDFDDHTVDQLSPLPLFITMMCFACCFFCFCVSILLDKCCARRNRIKDSSVIVELHGKYCPYKTEIVLVYPTV